MSQMCESDDETISFGNWQLLGYNIFFITAIFYRYLIF
jgi:hypothetical protein